MFTRLTTIANALIIIILMVTPAFAMEKINFGDWELHYDEMLQADTTGDGQEDRQSYYLDDQLVFTAYDTDANGQADLWMHYNANWEQDLEFHDMDGDGQPDAFYTVGDDEEAQAVELASIPSPEAPGIDPIIWGIAGVGVILFFLILRIARRKRK